MLRLKDRINLNEDIAMPQDIKETRAMLDGTKTQSDGRNTEGALQ